MVCACSVEAGSAGGNDEGVDEGGDEPLEDIDQAASADRTCANGVKLGQMQARVTAACKQATANKACSMGIPCDQIDLRAGAETRCAWARIDVVDQCFTRVNIAADKAHIDRIKYHQNRAQNCINIGRAMVAAGVCKPVGPGRN
jgi:hypothetical protein